MRTISDSSTTTHDCSASFVSSVRYVLIGFFMAGVSPRKICSKAVANLLQQLVLLYLPLRTYTFHAATAAYLARGSTKCLKAGEAIRIWSVDRSRAVDSKVGNRLLGRSRLKTGRVGSRIGSSDGSSSSLSWNRPGGLKGSGGLLVQNGGKSMILRHSRTRRLAARSHLRPQQK
jgi:hypothetical protein